ncbi:hypothetical protein [Thalassospira sp.]|uniref:hypothetical protein n=1 Tax=Thalassospira sp. TaxID=1912094 RepID=UPI0032EE915E
MKKSDTSILLIGAALSVITAAIGSTLSTYFVRHQDTQNFLEEFSCAIIPELNAISAVAAEIANGPQNLDSFPNNSPLLSMTALMDNTIPLPIYTKLLNIENQKQNLSIRLSLSVHATNKEESDLAELQRAAEKLKNTSQAILEEVRSLCVTG